MAFVEVAKVDEIKSGEGKTIEVNGKTIALFNADGMFYAIDNTCAHRQGPLGEGYLDGKLVTCPLHGWQYDVTNGECQTMPNMHVASYKTKIENGTVFVEL
ncbi:MAG: non-heme iron oxygenase ferredoxin subunit [archaeon]|nr:non-heme iron oxygenase ferredoxin subunit [archaeon]